MNKRKRGRPRIHAYAIRDQNGRRETIYVSWTLMRQRCLNEKAPDYHYYGGRGIKICARWNSFQNFFEDMQESYYLHKQKFSNTSLDRIDVNGGYSSENCRWATRKDQSNNRTDTTMITYKGLTRPLESWLDQIPIIISHKELYRRVITRKWDIEKAFTQSPRKRKK